MKNPLGVVRETQNVYLHTQMCIILYVWFKTLWGQIVTALPANTNGLHRQYCLYTRNCTLQLYTTGTILHSCNRVYIILYKSYLFVLRVNRLPRVARLNAARLHAIIHRGKKAKLYYGCCCCYCCCYGCGIRRISKYFRPRRDLYLYIQYIIIYILTTGTARAVLVL